MQVLLVSFDCTFLLCLSIVGFECRLCVHRRLRLQVLIVGFAFSVVLVVGLILSFAVQCMLLTFRY